MHICFVINLENEILNSVTSTKPADDFFIFNLVIPKTLPYFVGHFPQFPILPAVGIIDISSFLIKKFILLNLDLPLKYIESAKFKTTILPDQAVRIEIKKIEDNNYSVLWYPKDDAGALPQLLVQITFGF